MKKECRALALLARSCRLLACAGLAAGLAAPRTLAVEPHQPGAPAGIAPGPGSRGCVLAKAPVLLSLAIEAPPGARLAGGTTRWQGGLERGARAVLEARYSVPDRRWYRFFGVAESRSGASALFRQVQVGVGEPPRAVAAPAPPVVTDSRGTRIMILPAQVVSP